VCQYDVVSAGSKSNLLQLLIRRVGDKG